MGKQRRSRGTGNARRNARSNLWHTPSPQARRNRRESRILRNFQAALACMGSDTFLLELLESALWLNRENAVEVRRFHDREAYHTAPMVAVILPHCRREVRGILRDHMSDGSRMLKDNDVYGSLNLGDQRTALD